MLVLVIAVLLGGWGPVGVVWAQAPQTEKAGAAVLPGVAGGLPAVEGQRWQVYDIREYTDSVDDTRRPEQAIIDWILQETGLEVWHGRVPAVLAADSGKVFVYHQPSVQRRVAQVIERFTSSQHRLRQLQAKVVTAARPGWRARAQPLLQGVDAHTPGCQAWVLRPTDVPVLWEILQGQAGFQQIQQATLVRHGRIMTTVATRPQNYVRDVAPAVSGSPAAQRKLGQINEGLALEIRPLLSADGRRWEAAVRLTIDRVERVLPVLLQAKSVRGYSQRTQVDAPQLVQFRLEETFRWPVEGALLVSTGMAPAPLSERSEGLLDSWRQDRCEVLMLLEPTPLVQPVSRDR